MTPSTRPTWIGTSKPLSLPPPLVFYDKAEFARATSHIALPLNAISALAPPGLAALLTHFGCDAVLGLAILCSCGALVILFILGRRRPNRLPA
jgi:hypothetical protein